ncbi:beta-lactamase [Myxococcus stipitatus DSM 14675]|uniref:Beta-lactamase n=1 Tax=Myxococcus stipitatus (strain DSM 14675 / JCM 12634 / Mx s8) TaxID=1278073 RepID=L7U851_MYXSD|nr:MBL fold metallo-hydrolase [Myxococcus stipitatus]AGC43762.1 beta-lactamase [Myxococcus stipitatus DSM 14675]
MKAVAAVLVLLPGLVSAQERDFSQVEVRATPVAGNIHLLQGAGGNIAVSVGPDGLLMVDTEFAPLTDKLRAALEKLGKQRLTYVVNTHVHSDHTGGNVAFGREATLVSHTAVRERMSKPRTRRGETLPPAPEHARPVVTFQQGMSLWFNGEEVRLTHLPTGHTDGDSVVLFVGSNVLHTGDLFFTDRFPVIDLEAGGNVEGYVRNSEALLAALPPGARIIPGHGALSGREELERFVAMLRETTALVRRKKAAGLTLAQVKAEGLPEKFRSFGEGHVKTDQWLERVYTSLGPSPRP